ncbi:MAG: heme lyase CcmF/NrfE family subunit [Desulfovibrionaceae bacterium]|nr:heme lyase CcmF/NrfE family subunit [Desulfovibrionaceae bacterium]MBF0514929.1 heme lyase CcmF/NrfE family subunit [Desulfovibrionaceae bacterium]
MHQAAYWSLLIALFLSVIMPALCALHLWRGEDGTVRLVERGHQAALLLMTASSVILTVALVRRDFSFMYVYEYTDAALPLFYAVTAFWAGQAGSLLLWAWLAGVFAVCFASGAAYAALSPRAKLLFWLFFLAIQAFFLLLLTGPSTPFLELVPPAPGGKGLNPLLRNPGMIFHPPLLFLGYAGFSIPACLGLACRLAGERVNWIRASRNFTLLAWIFLTAGIILGGWWSYMELGWGGYWAWDPVENASLAPWLTGTAFLHTAAVETRRGALRATNVALIALTLLLCFFGTYIVRSGVIESLHAFGEGGVGQPLLVMVACFAAVAALVLSLGGQDSQAQSKPLPGLYSLPGFLVLACWLFCALAAVILIATMWPALSAIWSAKPQGLDAAFYNRVCNPMFALLAGLLAFCPWLSWKQGARSPLMLALVAVVAAGAAAVAALAFHITLPSALAGVALACAAMASISLLFIKESYARTRRGGLGAYLTHCGLALTVLGVAVSGPYQTAKEAVLAPDQTLTIGAYTVTNKGLTKENTPAMFAATATLPVEKNGRPAGELAPQRRLYRNFEQPFAEVSTVPSLGDELYATLLGFTDDGAVSVKVSVNPLVNWVWIGGTVMCLAALLCLRRFRGDER